MDKEEQPLKLDLELGTQQTNENEPRSGRVRRWSEGFDVPNHETTKFNEPQPILDLTKEKETRTGSAGRASKAFLGPNPINKPQPIVQYGANDKDIRTQKAKVVLATTKPGPSSKSEIPGLWPSSFNHEYCCIYRVPTRLRRVNPQAYYPQMLLIGPLHHSKKAKALNLAKTDSRYLDYLNMERHKKEYLKQITQDYGNKTIEEFKKIIKRDEQFIRESYAESTDWIESEEFQEMILHDSVFILGFFIKTGSTQNINKKEDILFQEPCLINTIIEDLMLLENQLPYALLENLFEPFFSKHGTQETFRDIILRTFRLDGKIRQEVNFRHFTDLFRRVRVETLGLTEEQVNSMKAKSPESITSLHNADKLDSAGVDFEDSGEENELSLVISFESGILKMPCFTAEDNTEKLIRNLMALEQCHYSSTAFVCNYIAFLDFLIDTEQDVDLLIKKGVVKNWLGHQGSVAEMVNKLCLGLVVFGSYYYPVSVALNKHYASPFNRSLATLRRVYFNDLWTGTATVAAVVLLVLTLIQTVTSVLQVMQGGGDDKSPPPAPSRGR